MSEEAEEQLSALMDGELSGPEQRRIIERLAGDRHFAERWTRYHLLRDVLRNNLPQRLSGDLAERVAARLAQEPIAFAPRAARRWQGLAKQAAGLGIAAAIATVAIISVPSVQRAQSGPDVVADNLAGTPGGREAATVSSTAPESAPQAWGRRALVVDSQFSGYLLNHNEYAVTSGFQGTLPYMRIVGSPAMQPQGTHENR